MARKENANQLEKYFVYFPFFRSPRITIRVAHEENENYLKKKITNESLLENRSKRIQGIV